MQRGFVLLPPPTAVHPMLTRSDDNRTGAPGVLLDMLTLAVLLMLVTLVAAAVWLLGRLRPAAAPVRMAPLASVLGAGWVLLFVLMAAASANLLPFQLDRPGQQACNLTRFEPGPEQRDEAVALARRSDVRGVREATGPGTPPSQRFYALERWCSSND